MRKHNIPSYWRKSKRYPYYASWSGSMINPQWLELPRSRTNFYRPKGVRAIGARLYLFFLVFLARLYGVQKELLLSPRCRRRRQRPRPDNRWINLMLPQMIDYCLKFYTVPTRSPGWPWGQGHELRIFMLNFGIVLVKVFERCISPLPIDAFSLCFHTLNLGLKFYALPPSTSCGSLIKVIDLDF